MGIFLTIHSINRWLIILAALAALVHLLLDINANREAGKHSRIASSAFTGLMDLQVLLGGVSFMLPAIMGDRDMHMTYMILAVIVAHLPAIWKKRNPAVYPKVMAGAIVVSLILIVLGVGALGGLVRWQSIYGIRF